MVGMESGVCLLLLSLSPTKNEGDAEGGQTEARENLYVTVNFESFKNSPEEPSARRVSVFRFILWCFVTDSSSAIDRNINSEQYHAAEIISIKLDASHFAHPFQQS
jgi:hypothetical protein